MPAGFLSERRARFAGGLLGIAVLGWSFFVDLQIGLIETCRVLAGLVCLWLPIGSLVYLALRDRCSDTLTRFTLSATASFGLTAPAYALFGVCGLAIPGFQGLFYVAQALTVAGTLAYALRRKWIWQRGDLVCGWRKLDWTLVLLVSLSILATHRYKATYEWMPDQASRRVVAHGDATYLAAVSYEMARRTPVAQQPFRSGLKDRAYHTFPHLNTMLIARYTGQPDMLRALMHYHFTVVEVLLCLCFFCIARRLTASRTAGYFAVALVFILAIPLPPVGRFVLSYFYFTWHTHATSNLEPSVLASPQMYCALPIVFGALLFVLQFSIQLSRRRAAGTLAVLAGLMTAVLIRFRIQSFLILFPGLMLLFAIVWYRTRQCAILAAGLLAGLIVATQVGEMRLPVYYPGTSNICLGNNLLAHNCGIFSAWPGADALRAALQDHLGEGFFGWTWQIVCMAIFALANVAGVPVVVASANHFLRQRTWQADTWAYSALVAWLAVGTVVGSTCLSMQHDPYSVGGQSLYLVGWYLLPLLAVGGWQICNALSGRLPAVTPYAGAVAVLVLLAASAWQRVRPNSDLQTCIVNGAPILSGEEWDAICYMRANLPPDAVVLSKLSHHHLFYCTFSGIAGRRTFLEYYSMAGYSGSSDDQTPARLARIDRVWNADNSVGFSAAVHDTGATHLVEYAEHPLPRHFSEALEEFWSSPTGSVKIWTFRGPTESAESIADTARRLSAAADDHCRAF